MLFSARIMSTSDAAKEEIENFTMQNVFSRLIWGECVFICIWVCMCAEICGALHFVYLYTVICGSVFWDVCRCACARTLMLLVSSVLCALWHELVSTTMCIGVYSTVTNRKNNPKNTHPYTKERSNLQKVQKSIERI